MAEENWNNQLEYLLKSRSLCHNDDYLEFLVKKVWHLSEPCKVADFGCGYGYLGTKLLPLLPAGSSYTGIDKSTSLLEEGKHIFAQMPYSHQFVEAEVYHVPVEDNSFDVTVSHALLMHLKQPADALNEMIRVTRDGGLVITCDANRNAWSALFHVDELNTQETTPLGLFQQMYKDIREKTGIDYNIGIKTPALMEKARLKNIGCRMSDCVIYLSPSMKEPEKTQTFEALCKEGLALPENVGKIKGKWRDRLLGHGVRPEDAERHINNELELDFRNKGKNYHTVFPAVLTWSYGTVEKNQ
jgi:ubiquinone/menaquinone biosynthesis C-methylase UbiE